MRGEELAPPPLAERREAAEILRVWAAPGEGQQVVLLTTWKDPAHWGLLLADLARHAAEAYSREGHERKIALARIVEGFEVEISFPTDKPSPL
jgi:hypothetical protein